MTDQPGKSWKREVAGATLIFSALLVLGIVALAFFVEGGATAAGAVTPLVSSVALAAIPSALAIFGLHYIKAPAADKG